VSVRRISLPPSSLSAYNGLTFHQDLKNSKWHVVNLSLEGFMPVHPKVAWKIKAAASVIAITVGLIFPLIFFAFSDPDRVKFSVVVSWFAIYFIPAALVISLKYRATLIVNAIVILAGFFLGTCVALIFYYPDEANLFPIAAVLWTIVAAIPVAFGSAIGFLIASIFYKQQ
jgi:hypothetical protein